MSVLTVKKNKFNTCLCEYCVNVEAKIKAINKRADELHTTECKLKDRYEAVNESLCISQSDQFPYDNMLCIKRECDKCGDLKVKSRFEALLKADEATSEECKWQIWENQRFKDSTGNSSTRKVLKDKEGRLEKLIDEFIAEIHSLAEHLFTARWQYTQFNNIRSHVPDKWVVTIADFSENYRCSHQDEIQSAYYQYSQATVHPIVAYYNCPSCQNCIVEESSVFISPDLKHDAQAVNQFTNKLLHHIQEKGVEVNHVVQYSDGCSAQYKSKGPFLDVSKSLMSNDFTFERSYFGSRHGKGPCDALGGIVKKCAETSVKSRRRTIRDAKELYEFCDEELTILPKKIKEGCEHKIRTFFYESNIKRHNLPKDLKTLSGTRKLHNVRTVEPGEVEVRNLSCYYSECQNGNSAMCSNTGYVTPWESHVICSGIRNKKKTQKAQGLNVQLKPSKENLSETGNDAKSTSLGVKESNQKVPVKPVNDNQSSPRVTVTSVVKESTNNVTDRKSYFRNVLSTLQKNTTFDGLKADANRYEKEISNMEIEGKPCSVLSLSATVDRVAHSILPSDIHEQDVLKYPVINGADGNCLPRCGSVYSFGNEDNHEEIRARLVIESVQHCDQYLDYKFLCRGTELTERSAKQLPSKFAMYSPMYCPGVKLTAPLIREIFEKETISIAKINTYMGIWQLFALASVLNCSIYSVYPNLGNPAVREDLNRRILPRGHKVVMDIHVMWTTTRSDMVASNWIPNHFVPVLPMNSQKDTTSLLDERKDDPSDKSVPDLNIQSLKRKTEESLDDSFTSTERDALEALYIGIDILDFVDVPEELDINLISSSDTKPPPADLSEIQMPPIDQTVTQIQMPPIDQTVTQIQVPPIDQTEGPATSVTQMQVPPIDQTEGPATSVTQIQVPPIDNTEVPVTSVTQMHVPPIDHTEEPATSVTQIQVPPIDHTEEPATAVTQMQVPPIDHTEVPVTSVTQMHVPPIDHTEEPATSVTQMHVPPIDHTEGPAISVTQMQVPPIDHTEVPVTSVTQIQVPPIDHTERPATAVTHIQVPPIDPTERPATAVTQIPTTSVTRIYSSDPKPPPAELSKTNVPPIDQTEGPPTSVTQIQVPPIDPTERPATAVTQMPTTSVTRIYSSDPKPPPAELSKTNVPPIDQTERPATSVTQIQVPPIDPTERPATAVTQIQVPPIDPNERPATAVTQIQVPPIDPTEGPATSVTQIQVPPIDPTERPATAVTQIQVPPIHPTEGPATSVTQIQVPPIDQTEGPATSVTQIQVPPIDPTEGPATSVTQIQVPPIDPTERPATAVTQIQVPPIDHTEEPATSVTQIQVPPIDQTERPATSVTQIQVPPIDPTERPATAVTQIQVPPIDQTERPATSVTQIQVPTIDQTERPATSVTQIQVPPIDPTERPATAVTQMPTTSVTRIYSSDPKPPPAELSKTSVPPIDQTERPATAVTQIQVPPIDQTEGPPTSVTQIQVPPIDPTERPATAVTQMPTTSVTRIYSSDPKPPPAELSKTVVTPIDQTERPATSVTQIQVPPIDPTERPATAVTQMHVPPIDHTEEPATSVTQIQVTSIDQSEEPVTAVTQIQVPSDPVDLPEQLVSYHSGDFVLIKHGSAFLPGVVDHWPWVKYFCKRKKLWLLNETKYTVTHGDILKKLEVPEICAAGSRLYYKFKQEDLK